MAKVYGTQAKKPSKVIKFYRGGEEPLLVEKSDFTIGEVVSLSLGERIDGKVVFSKQHNTEFSEQLLIDLQADLDNGTLVSVSIWG